MIYTTLMLLFLLSSTHAMDVQTAEAHYNSLTEKLGYRPSSMSLCVHSTQNHIIENHLVPTILTTEFEIPSLSIIPFLRSHLEGISPHLPTNYLSSDIICYDRHHEKNSPVDITSGILILNHLRNLGVKKITRHSIGTNVNTVLHELYMLTHDDQGILNNLGITAEDRSELLRLYTGGIILENPQFDETDYNHTSTNVLQKTFAYIPGSSYIKSSYAYYMGHAQEPIQKAKLNSLDLCNKLSCLKEMDITSHDSTSLSFLVLTFNGTTDDHIKNLKHVAALPAKTYWIPSLKTEDDQTCLTCDGAIIIPDDNQISAMNAYKELQNAAHLKQSHTNGTKLIRLAEEYYKHDLLKQYQSIIYGLSAQKTSK